MTFTNWLKKQRHRDDPVGDLARDVDLDKRMRKYRHESPIRGPLIAYLTRILPGTEAGELAVAAFEEALAEWKKQTSSGANA